jgi:Calx-beta domain
MFTVTLSASSTSQGKVSCATADGTARSGEDYEAAAGTLAFAPGDSRKGVGRGVLQTSMSEPALILSGGAR